MIWTLGIYKTRAAAEAAIGLWLDVYPEEAFDITFEGTHYTVTVSDDPR